MRSSFDYQVISLWSKTKKNTKEMKQINKLHYNPQKNHT